MALQTKTIKANGSTGHHTFTLTVVEDSTNIANNTSSLSWSFSISPIGKYDWYYNTAPVTYSVVINGVEHTGSIASYAATDTVVLKTGTATITHNADGKKDITISFSVTSNKTYSYLPGSAKASDTMTLSNIARYAKITAAPVTFTDEENPKITYSNPAGNNVTTLKACISWTGYADIEYRDISKTGTEYTFNLTDTERKKLRQAVTNANGQLSVNFFVWSVIGSGEKRDYLNSTLQLVNYLPTIAPTAEDTNIPAQQLTGNPNKIIKGYNYLSYAVNPTVRKEATITSVSVKCGSKSSNKLNGELSRVDDNVIYFKITDSRGNVAEDSITFNMVNYIPLTINQKVTPELVGETGAKFNVTLTGNYFSGNFGAVNNSISFRYHIKEENGDWQDWVSITASPNISNNSYNVNFTISNLSYDKSYTVQCRAADMVDIAQTPEYISNVTPIFDWSNNDFNFNVPVSIQGDTINDFVIETGTEAMGSNGIWYWSKWKSGKAECYGKRNYGNMGISTPWGSWYETSQSFKQNFPSGLFITAPDVVEANVVSTSGAAFISVYSNDLSATSTGSFVVSRPTSMTLSQVYIGFRVIGRWK